MNLSKHILVLLAALFSFGAAFSQDNKVKENNKEKSQVYKLNTTVKSVKALLKESKFQNANDEINKVIKEHEEARKSAYLYSLQSQALYNLVLSENKKMYLKQKADTAKYFSYIRDMYRSALICDSLDVLPNEKGKVEIKYRNTNQQRLVQFRKNLSTADKYFYQKKDYKNAYEFADLYLSTRGANIFINEKGENVLDAENDSSSHASLAVFLAYAYNNNKGVVKYLPIAINDSSKLVQILEVGSKAYYELGDTTSAHELLYLGIDKYPTTEYFYMSLVKYYNTKNEYSRALDVINKVIISMPENRNCLFLKAKEHEYLKQYDTSIEILNKILSLYQNDFEALSALGSIYLYRAHESYDGFNLKITDAGYASGREKINNYYKQAKTAYEKCRKCAENNTDLWLVGLRECYYKLNLGKELKQLEKSIK